LKKIKLYKPSLVNYDISIIELFLNNLNIEIKNNIYNQKELKFIFDKKIYGKFLNQKEKHFFLYHFLFWWDYSIKTIFFKHKSPKILEIGCSTGTSSYLFSLLGARVIGIDINETFIDICKKRKFNYFGEKSKNVVFKKSDALNFSYREGDNYDFIYSLFAFNLIQPTRILIKKIFLSLNKGGKILIIDGNHGNIYNRLYNITAKSIPLKPFEMSALLNKNGYSNIKITYHCIIPPFFFRNLLFQKLGRLFERFIRSLNLMSLFCASYSIVAEKN
tara:strand:- start:16461 stop:17285 length:825 start_codon:yes stop_codon:yes gene_type:complete